MKRSALMLGVTFAVVRLQPGVTNHFHPKQAHNVTNSGATDPLKLVSFFIAEKGQPLAAPVK